MSVSSLSQVSALKGDADVYEAKTHFLLGQDDDNVLLMLKYESLNETDKCEG